MGKVNQMTFRLFSMTVAALALMTATVSAHVVADPNRAAAGSYFRTALRISHGCHGAATVAVHVRVPPEIVSIRPQVKPGWEITVNKRKLAKPIPGPHGPVTEQVEEIIWRGGPLPDAFFDEFGLSMKLPGGAEGKTLYFPVIQECGEDRLEWTGIPQDGQAWHDLPAPAPFVTLTGQ